MANFRKYVKKAKRAVKKRYTKKTGGLNYRKIVSDVASLKRVLNPELKRFNQGNLALTGTYLRLGQVQGTNSGYVCIDITPSPAQGVSDTTRNGDSIRLNHIDFKFQLIKQSQNFNGTRVKFWIIHQKGIIQTDANAMVAQFLNLNTFNGLYDFNSDRNYDLSKQVSVMKTGYISVPVSTMTSNGQTLIKDYSFKQYFKNFHVKFVNNSQTIGSGQLFLLMVADAGNSSSNTAATAPNIPNTAINSGLYLNYDLTSFYYDN